MNLYDFYSENFNLNKSELSLNNYSTVNNKAVFLDRDGVLIEDVNHIDCTSKVIMCKNVIPFLKEAIKNKFDLVIVTNQSSISRGIISYKQYLKITECFLNKLEEEILPHFILASFHLPNNSNCLDDFNWRKPGTGMFKYIIKKRNYDVSKCYMIGDKLTDLIPAYQCKIPNLFFIQSNEHKNEKSKIKKWNKIYFNSIKINKELNPDFFYN